MDYNAILSSALRYLTARDYPRIWSWDICRKDFLAARKAKVANGKLSKFEFDYLARSLAIYLSSWGMYRGSGKLLFRNYLQFMDAVKIIVASDYWDDKRSEGKKIGLYNQLHDKGYSELSCQKMISCVFGTVIPMDETNKEGLRVLCKYMKMSNNKLSLPSISNLYSFGSDNPIIEFFFQMISPFLHMQKVFRIQMIDWRMSSYSGSGPAR